jgi:thrombospondin type 3 repeat protein
VPCNGAFEVQIDFRDDQVHQMALYILDYDGFAYRMPRTSRIEVIDADTGAVLSKRTIGAAERGKYVIWNVKGHIRVRFVNVEGINSVLSGIFFDPARAGTPGETIWVDEPPDIAQAGQYAPSGTWSWVANPRYSGEAAHQSPNYSPGAFHQHYFFANPITITPEPDDELFCWVFIDPSNPPSMVMLQWMTDDGSSWSHRAYWGANQSWFGVDGTPSRWRVSTQVPASGTWTRLAVPAYKVDLVGRKITGMAYSLVGGTVVWDRAGTFKGLVDTDNDALPDEWELAHFAGSLAQGALGDPDGDGLINFQELQRNANPNNLNTDGDIWWFGAPFTDGEEMSWVYFAGHTDPNGVDSDGDGLTDTDEMGVYWTDPVDIDTDNDICTDGQEVLYTYTDPRYADAVDSDSDALTDCEEINRFGTDPNYYDTDWDGIGDGDEVNAYYTDPLNYDTDSDGYSDSEELFYYGTDPRDPNSHP